jgi:hypothetical protein
MEFSNLGVPKKADSSGEKKWIVMVDIRKRNYFTVGDNFPMPMISEIFGTFRNSNISLQ